MDEFLFDEVAEAVRGLVPADIGELHLRARRWGVKAWFDTADPGREHFEAQVISNALVPGARVLGIEIGFHAEHREAERNAAVIAALLDRETVWREVLGGEAEVGGFLGRPDQWQRVSEAWADPDLGDSELGWEIATRLTDYIVALEPIRRLG